MVGRCVLNKGACFLSFSLAFLIILLFNKLTYSNSTNFKLTGNLFNSASSSFGIIIDAGSTGSRLFLYKWSSRSDKELIDIRAVIDDEGNPIVKKVTPGLSSFAKNPEAAPEYIIPLLRFAADHIPEERRRVTPVFIFATAGMRLLSAEQQDSIVGNLRKALPGLTDLKIVSENIRVIPGKWEGIYSWIAVNYMLGRFNLSNLPDMTTTNGNNGKSKEANEEWKNERPKTAGMIDMGGASAQIAFELPIHEPPSIEHSKQEKYNNENIELINLGSHDDDRRYAYRIFVTTFLGFGVNEGAKKYEKFLWKQLKAEDGNANNKNTSKEIPLIFDGCLPVDFLKLTSVEEEDQQFVRKGDGNWDQCVQDIASLIFSDNTNCPITKSCFFGGIKAPSEVRLSDVELYGFSEYWYSVDDVLSLGGLYDHDKFETKAKEFCQRTWRTIKKEYRSKFFPKADEDRIETQCFKSAWIHAILHNGFFVEEHQNHFQSAFRINGQEVQWSLGAMIYQQRYFPLQRKDVKNDDSVMDDHKNSMTINKKLHANTSNEWTVFYLLAILAVLFLLWRIRCHQKAQLDAGKSFKYKRLDTSNV